jgi:hypothetical protein
MLIKKEPIYKAPSLWFNALSYADYLSIFKPALLSRLGLVAAFGLFATALASSSGS